MKYAIFLDDERIPKTNKEFIILRSCDDAETYVLEHGLPEYVSFDHDLGREMIYTDEHGTIPSNRIAKTGYDFAKFLVDYMISNGLTEMFEWNVHSANPVGAHNIDSYLKGFANFLDDQ